MSTDADQPETAGISFEAAIERLEQIVSSLEDDQLDLEQALAAYEEGVALARVCLKRLDTAELRIQELNIDHE